MSARNALNTIGYCISNEVSNFVNAKLSHGHGLIHPGLVCVAYFDHSVTRLGSTTMAPSKTLLRRDTPDMLPTSAGQRPLRVVGCGTLFLTHTLSVGSHPQPAEVVRAHSVTRTRGGSASTCLSIAAQFPGVEAMLVAPLGGNEEGKIIISDLEQERVSTKYCKIWEQSGVPSAWVLHAGESVCQFHCDAPPLFIIIVIIYDPTGFASWHPLFRGPFTDRF